MHRVERRFKNATAFRKRKVEVLAELKQRHDKLWSEAIAAGSRLRSGHVAIPISAARDVPNASDTPTRSHKRKEQQYYAKAYQTVAARKAKAARKGNFPVLVRTG